MIDFTAYVGPATRALNEPWVEVLIAKWRVEDALKLMGERK